MAVKIVVTLKCDAIVDGKKCEKDAEYQTEEDNGGIIICQTCLDLMRDKPERVAFPARMGKKFQTDLVEQVLKMYTNNTLGVGKNEN